MVVVTDLAPLVLWTADAEETRLLAEAVAGLCVPGDVVLLAGDLGAGKTTFAQGFGRALGIVEPITSPTFTLVRQYPLGELVAVHGAEPIRTLFHADVYRLDSLGEIVELGLGELVEDGGVALVEWGDVAEPVLGEGSLAVRLAAGIGAGSKDQAGGGGGACDDSADSDDDADDHRTITIASCSARWAQRWVSLADALQPWAVGA